MRHNTRDVPRKERPLSANDTKQIVMINSRTFFIENSFRIPMTKVYFLSNTMPECIFMSAPTEQTTNNAPESSRFFISELVFRMFYMKLIAFESLFLSFSISIKFYNLFIQLTDRMTQNIRIHVIVFALRTGRD